MKHTLTILTALALLSFASCSTKNNYKEVAGDVDLNFETTEQKTTDNKVEVPIDRKIIKQGDISFETEDVKITKALIIKAVDEFQGYISKDNIYVHSDRISHRLVIRVLSEKFDQLLDRISENAKKLDSKNIDVLDVTEEYIDIEARIKTKKELENRYKEILKEAKTIEEILSIEKEIGILRTDIESIEGRLRYLKNSIALSTLTVEYYQRTSSAFRFSSKFGHALVTGWNWFLSFIIGLTNIWPFLLIIIAGIILGFRIDRKKKNKKNAS